MLLSEQYASAHESPNGPGDARPSAMQVIKDEGLEGRMKGFVVLITGGNSGLGLETAKALHATGAEVVLPVRSKVKGDEAVKQIQEANKSEAGAGSLKVMHIDMSRLESVRKFATEFKAQYEKLNLLINNAGIMACPHSHTEEGFETQFGVNHLAHFLLFWELKDLLLQSSKPDHHSRIICLSSLGHRRCSVKFDDLDFQKEEYQPSKTANIWMASEIERRYGAQGLHAWSVHPGGIQTNLGRHLDPSFFEKMSQNEGIKKVFKDAPQGAATTVWTAVGTELEGRGGAYCEDCHVSKPAPEKEDLGLSDPGYAKHAYDEAGAKKLWEESLRMVGVQG